MLVEKLQTERRSICTPSLTVQVRQVSSFEVKLKENLEVGILLFVVVTFQRLCEGPSQVSYFKFQGHLQTCIP